MTADREERRELAAGRPLEGLIAAARAYPDEPAGARRRLMDRVRAEAERGTSPSSGSGLRSAWAWWVRPRTLRVRMATVALASAAVVAGLWIARDAGHPAPVVDAGDGVQFVHLAPDARAVSLVGDFNDWEPGATPLRRSGPNGVWTAVVTLAPGRHAYAFLVDDVWMADPIAPRAPDDGFGTPSSVVVVAGGRS